MATLSRLVETIAKWEGMDPATVRLIARTVREAGLITTGGRGTSAGKMTYSDASNLLIAVNASASAQEAPETVRKYRRLVLWSEGKHRVLSTFSDALEQLIEAQARHGTLPKTYLSMPMPRLLSQKHIGRIRLCFYRPDISATLDISVTTDPSGPLGVTATASQLSKLSSRKANKVTNLTCRFQSLNYDSIGGDRRDTTVIGRATIRAVSSLLEYGID